jgi:HK97 family phage major capsid protein
MNELAEIIKAESRDWAESETAEFETLEQEIKTLDGDIRIKTVECMNASTAKEVVSQPSPRGPVFWKQPEDQKEQFQGQNFTRKAIAKALAYLDGVPPWAVAENRWGKTNPKLVEIMKTDMQAGSTSVSHWMNDLVITDGRYTGDFIEYLKAKTIFDRLPLREIPPNVTVKGQDGAATGYWIPQGVALKVTELTTMSVALVPFKVAALAVVTNELLRYSSPSAEMIVRDALVTASAQIVDTTFLGAAAAGTGYPAGMLNAVVAVATNGTDGTALRSDIRDLYAAFITAKNASGLWFVMNPALAKAIQLLSNTLGVQEFPSINQDGGTLLGDPVVTGDNVGSNDLILLKPSDIWRIGDTGVEVSVSREAMIEMADNPAMEVNTPATPTQKFASMFQTESTAIKIVRAVNFQKRRSTAVQFITDAVYGTASS